MNKEDELQMLVVGRDALITAIMALNNHYFVDHVEDLRDEVNCRIKELKEFLRR